MNAMSLSPQGGLHPVRDPSGQHVRPLPHGLFRNADGLGRRCDRAAEQVDGCGLEHGPFHHSSRRFATIVLGTVLGMDDGGHDYADRLRDAMKYAGVDYKALAKALGVTSNAIKKVLDRGSASLSALNNSRAAAHLGINPDWLATGDGAMVREEHWPFVRVTRDQIVALADVDRLLLEGQILQAMHNLKPHAPDELPEGVVLIPERRRAAAKQRQGGLRSINNPSPAALPVRRRNDEKKKR
jgi:transcriptional regulator with XRE-family HTH domain